MIEVKLTTALVVAAAVWPAGAYAIPDPDVPVAPKAPPAVAVSAPQDLRSPDARDAAREAVVAPKAVPEVAVRMQHDLRSPDARDAARVTAVAPAESARVSPGPTAPSVSDGFEWGDAGIGAAVMLALVGMASGTLLLFGRNRQRTPTT
jgi:hypothetical protein